MNQTGPRNPLHFRVQYNDPLKGVLPIPAKKNNRQPQKRRKKNGQEFWVSAPNNNVKSFMKLATPQLQDQMQQYDITYPLQGRIVLWGYVTFYLADIEKIESNDLDNAFTTIYDLIQTPRGKSKTGVGIIKDDNQLSSVYTDKVPVSNPSIQALSLWLWESDGRPYMQQHVDFYTTVQPLDPVTLKPPPRDTIAQITQLTGAWK